MFRCIKNVDCLSVDGDVSSEEELEVWLEVQQPKFELHRLFTFVEQIAQQLSRN